VIDLPVAEVTSTVGGGGFSEVPGLRTFRSAAFRTAVAAVLLSVGAVMLGVLLAGQAGSDDGQYAIDFGDYHGASIRLSAGQSPYTAEVLAGPIDAQGVGRYRYPPLFAQLMQPLAGLGIQAAALIWFVLQAAAVFVAVWVGTGIGGARRSLERALWCGVAALYFLPVFDTLWKGNVSGILALSGVSVALGGTAAGVGAAAGALLKSVPGTLVPAALVMGTRSRFAVVLGLGLPLVVSFVAAPGAWLDYPRVVLNMLAGSADYATNLAPATLLDRAGLPDAAVTLARIVTLVLAGLAVVGSILLARRRDGVPAAALLGTAALLLVPGSLWYHYLVVLLPFAAMAWPRARSRERTALALSAALISLSLAWLPLAIVGAVLMFLVSALVIWPRAGLEATT
jgi:hypothetical protein